MGEAIGRAASSTPIILYISFIGWTLHRDLEALVSEEKFREDLFFRINIIPIHLPPLRERLEDVPLLVEHFLCRLRRRSGKDITGLTREAMNILLDNPWPGNVRELKGALEYAVVLAEDGLITPEHLPPELSGRVLPPTPPPETETAPEADEKTALIQAWRQAGGNQSRAAALLGVSRVTVWHRMKKFGIDVHKLVTS